MQFQPIHHWPRKTTARGSARILAAVIVIVALLLPAPTAVAEGPQPGASDPAATYSEWPDDEIFTATPPVPGMTLDPFCPGGKPHSYVFETTGDLSAWKKRQELCVTEYHDAIDAAAGRILGGDRDAVIYAYALASGAARDLVLQFADPATGYVAYQPDLAARVAGGSDFFAVAAGDVDGALSDDGDLRDEVVVAYAQPEAGNQLPVTVAVLDFATATATAPQPVAQTLATAPGKLDAASVTSGAIKPVDNALAVALGDFDGDTVDDIGVAYLSGPASLSVDVFRYHLSITGGEPQRTLELAGTGQVNLQAGYAWNETLALAAGDFDGDGRDELAAGTVDYATTGDRQTVHVRMFDVSCQDNVGCASKPLTVSQVKERVPHNGAGGGVTWRVDLAAGLFKVDPAAAWGMDRRQLAVAYSQGADVVVQSINVQANLDMEVSSPTTIAAANQFWLGAGGIKGSRNSSDPYWSLALLTWTGQSWKLQMLQPDTGAGAPALKTYATALTQTTATAGARLPLALYDFDGDGMFLGQPVHMVVENLISTDFILEEPPKHAYWDPVTQQVVNVSRADGFNIALVSSQNEEFSTNSKDSTDWSIGSSVGGSAAETVAENLDVGILKESAELSVQLSGKVAYDYDQKASSYTSGYANRTVSFSGTTARDDFIVGRLQMLDVWRYRIYGMEATDSSQSPFLDIVMPGPYSNLTTDAGGLNFDWYQPTHENGNVLSYPAFDASIAAPSDLGEYSIPCPTVGDPSCNTDGTKTIRALLLDPSLTFWDGTAGTKALNFSTASGAGVERTISHSLSESAAFKGSYKVTVAVGNKRAGGSSTTAFTAEAELHNKNSWSNNTTASSKTTSSTGITLNRSAGNASQAYGIYPVVYTSTDGTIKVLFAADPLASASGKYWWIDQYGQKPDLALNLPMRFYPTITQYGQAAWAPQTSLLRKQMRGFFVRQNTINPLTNDYEYLSGAALDGDTVRLEARVYNYSVTQGAPAGAKVRFEAVAYDWSKNQEIGERQVIGTAILPALGPRQMTTATVSWNTTGKSSGSSQQYRIYVLLDVDNLVDEKYETETAASQTYTDTRTGAKIDPGQNNEGYGYLTVAAKAVGDPEWGKPAADISMAPDGLAAVDLTGSIVNGSIDAWLGEPLPIRISVKSNTRSSEYSHVLIYDGDPAQGGKLIGGKDVFVGDTDAAGSAVWLYWTPLTLGVHQVVAKVLERVSDTTPGNNSAQLEVEVIAVPLEPGAFSSYLPIISR